EPGADAVDGPRRLGGGVKERRHLADNGTPLAGETPALPREPDAPGVVGRSSAATNLLFRLQSSCYFEKASWRRRCGLQCQSCYPFFLSLSWALARPSPTSPLTKKRRRLTRAGSTT